MLAVVISPRGSITALTSAATLSQAHLIQRGFGTGGRTPGKILLSRVLTAIHATSCRTPVVNPDNLNLANFRERKQKQRSEHGSIGNAHSKLVTQPFSSFATGGKPNLLYRRAQPLGQARRCFNEIWKPFCEHGRREQVGLRQKNLRTVSSNRMGRPAQGRSWGCLRYEL
jgi:hypothetical protein